MSDEFQDPDELLFRQAHPKFLVEGRVTSQLFKPTPKDEGKPSAYRSGITTAEESFRFHTLTLGFEAAGTWAISVSESRAVGVPPVADPITEPEEKANAAHVVLDMTHLDTRGAVEKVATRLAEAARRRGRIYPA